uniref:8-amino-7-oxononanoate synthase n=1 Tax=Rhizophora mucronata TaxID=61149 RepID=A0A2P2IT13_RHIMU
MEKESLWDHWVEEALAKLESKKLLRSLRPIDLSTAEPSQPNTKRVIKDDYEFFDELRSWDRSSVEVSISEATYNKWLLDIPSSGDDDAAINGETGTHSGKFKKLLLFSGNDYLGLSSHPTIRNAAAKVYLLLLIFFLVYLVGPLSKFNVVYVELLRYF